MTLEALSYHLMLTTKNLTSEDLKLLSFMKYALSRENIFLIERYFKVQKLNQKEREIINK